MKRMTPTGDTIGVEIEIPSANRGDIQYILNLIPSEVFSTTRDASIEIPVGKVLDNGSRTLPIVMNSVVEGTSIDFGGRRDIFGAEVVTSPLTLEDADKFILIALQQLNNNGEFSSNRCSIHFHKGFPLKLSMLKNALAFGLAFEDVLYFLSGHGKRFRGESNNYAYARPLNYGTAVQIAGRGGFYARIPNLNYCFSSQNVEQFFNGFGVDISNVGKYHPARYFSLSLLSVALRGTLEIRTSNFSVNYRGVSVLLKIFAESVEKMYCTDFVEIFKKIGGSRFSQNRNYYRDRFNLLIETVKPPLDGRDIKYLEWLLENGPIPKPPDVDVKSHLRNFSLPESMAINIIRGSSGLKDPGNIDIHTLDIIEPTILEE